MQALPGYFIHSDPDADPTQIGPNPPAFGLSNQSSDAYWSDFKSELTRLQSEAPPGVKYAVCWLGRHGEGWHNVVQDLYGGRAWDTHWSLVDMDGTTRLVDADLTKLGEEQARQARRVWTTELARPDPVPLPTKFFCSPLTRAAQTLEITFSEILTTKSIRPYIIEDLRERNGLRICNKRRSKTFLHERFPGFDFEPGFTEEDEAWSPSTQELDEDMRKRLKRALNVIFGSLLGENDTCKFQKFAIPQ
ncbi:histidine phosphatase family containing protein [Ceratobasidium sp. AG-Ba]|nr:histidine phosphatase family containing protein [Ceratobasidium sp. AG-Ba]QRW11554.1 histidine phosphatase family containing protein [Ceratobasidium sp. AG-Ba]